MSWTVTFQRRTAPGVVRSYTVDFAGHGRRALSHYENLRERMRDDDDLLEALVEHDGVQMGRCEPAFVRVGRKAAA